MPSSFAHQCGVKAFLWLGYSLLLSLTLFSHSATADPRPQPQLLLQGSRTDFFEDAFQATFVRSEVDVKDTLQSVQQLSQLLLSQEHRKEPHVAALLSEAHHKQLLDSAQLLAADTQLDDAVLEAALTQLTTLLQQQATSQQGYPLLRRLVVGGLIKQRAARGAPFKSRALQQAANSVLLQLFLVHQRAVATKPAIQYFHVSKSGGTNMCSAAESNGCAAQGFSFSDNCKVPAFHDFPRWLTPVGHQVVHKALTGVAQDDKLRSRWWVSHHNGLEGRPNCSQRADVLRAKGWNFYAMELAAPDGSPCQEFVTLMLWRHPVARMESHIRFTQQLYHRYQYEGHQQLDRTAFAKMDSALWRLFLPVGTDNQYIRALLGLHLWTTPLEPVTQLHMERAKLQTVQQDVLLLLEQSSFNDLAFKVGLGWDHGLSRHKVRPSQQSLGLYLPKDMRELVALNQPDIRVYEFATSMAVIDVLVWRSVQAMHDQLGPGLGLGLDPAAPYRQRCGYVSMHQHEQQPQQQQ